MSKYFVSVKIHLRERPQDFGRFKVEWTPTIILAEPDGRERYRFVGYLPAEDFLAQLQLGRAKAAFSRAQYEDAGHHFAAVVSRFPESEAAPEALYWSAVSAYKATSNPAFLKQGGEELRAKYPRSDWARKGSVWVS